jgi:hypothetical protein
MSLTVGSLKMRTSIFHSRKQQDSILGMITRRNQYKSLTTQEAINANNLVDYLDRFSFEERRKY